MRFRPIVPALQLLALAACSPELPTEPTIPPPTSPVSGFTLGALSPTEAKLAKYDGRRMAFRVYRANATARLMVAESHLTLKFDREGGKLRFVSESQPGTDCRWRSVAGGLEVLDSKGCAGRMMASPEADSAMYEAYSGAYSIAASNANSWPAHYDIPDSTDQIGSVGFGLNGFSDSDIAIGTVGKRNGTPIGAMVLMDGLATGADASYNTDGTVDTFLSTTTFETGDTVFITITPEGGEFLRGSSSILTGDAAAMLPACWGLALKAAVYGGAAAGVAYGMFSTGGAGFLARIGGQNVAIRVVGSFGASAVGRIAGYAVSGGGLLAFAEAAYSNGRAAVACFRG